jgi:(2Fe-2S) ferredoxin
VILGCVGDHAPRGPLLSTPVRLRVCRDCCCGTAKHADVDHDAQLGAFERLTNGHAEVIKSACLSVCEESNVVVVVPSTQGRMSGGKPVWFSSVLADVTVARIAAWIREGGPGLADLPADLAPSVMTAAGLTSNVMSTFGGPC